LWFSSRRQRETKASGQSLNRFFDIANLFLSNFLQFLVDVNSLFESAFGGIENERRLSVGEKISAGLATPGQ
jgi:hypothetical protein